MSTALAWSAGCSQGQSLKVGIHPWVGYESLELAQQFKWLPEGVELVRKEELNTSGAALQSGQVDAACLTLDEVLRLRAEGTPVTVGLVFDVSAGADALLVRPGIDRLADLSGKRVGVEPGPLGALVLGSALAAAGLARSSVRVIDVPAERQLAAWRRSEVDALVCYEPTATLLQREGARRLFDSRQMPDTIVDVLAVRTDRISGREENLKALVSAHFRGLKHLQGNRQDALYRIAQRQGMTPQEVGQALAGVFFPTLEANRQYLAPAGRLHDSASKVSKLLLRDGLVKKEDALDKLANATWLPRDED
jgi:NitT/TauT family transport system substrate-binding protein